MHVFNPQYIGGVASTFRWSPVDGCEDPATAIRRADAFAFAVSQQYVLEPRLQQKKDELPGAEWSLKHTTTTSSEND